MAKYLHNLLSLWVSHFPNVFGIMLRMAFFSSSQNRNARYWIDKGEELASLRQYSQALACFDRAIALQPDNARAWYGKAIVQNDTHQFQEALMSIENVLKLDEENQSFRLLKELILIQIGNRGSL